MALSKIKPLIFPGFGGGGSQVKLSRNPIELLLISDTVFPENGQARYNSYTVAITSLAGIPGNTKIQIMGEEYLVKSSIDPTLDYDNPYHIPIIPTFTACELAKTIANRLNNNPRRLGDYVVIVDTPTPVTLYNTLSATNINYFLSCLPTTAFFVIVSLKLDTPLNLQILNNANVSHPSFNEVEITQLETYAKRNNYKIVVYPAYIDEPHDTAIVYEDHRYTRLPAQHSEVMDNNPIIDPVITTPTYGFGAYYPYSYERSKSAYFNLQGVFKGIFKEELPILSGYPRPTNIEPMPYALRICRLRWGAAYNNNYLAQENSANPMEFREVYFLAMDGKIPDDDINVSYRQEYCADNFSTQDMLDAGYMYDYFFDGGVELVKFLNTYAKKEIRSGYRDYLYVDNFFVIGFPNVYVMSTRKYLSGGNLVDYGIISNTPDITNCPSSLQIKVSRIPLETVNFDEANGFGFTNLKEIEITIVYKPDPFIDIPLFEPIIYYPLSEKCEQFCVLYKNRFGLFETCYFYFSAEKFSVESEKVEVNPHFYLPEKKQNRTITTLPRNTDIITRGYLINPDKALLQDIFASDSLYIIENNKYIPVVLENSDFDTKDLTHIKQVNFEFKRRLI